MQLEDRWLRETYTDLLIEYAKKDSAKLEAAKNGTSNRSWVDETLRLKNAEIIKGRHVY